MESRIKIILILAVASVVVASVGYAAYFEYLKRIRIRGNVTMIGIEIYWTKECINPIIDLDWGDVKPGYTYSTTWYIKSTSDCNITLMQVVEHWNPYEASLYLHPSWNYTGQIIQPNQVIAVIEWLKVDADIHGIYDFYYEYVIVAVD